MYCDDEGMYDDEGESEVVEDICPSCSENLDESELASFVADDSSIDDDHDHD